MTVDELGDLISELQGEGLGYADIRIPSQTGGNKDLDECDLIIEDAEHE